MGIDLQLVEPISRLATGPTLIISIKIRTQSPKVGKGPASICVVLARLDSENRRAEFFNLTNQANPKLINNFFIMGAPGPQFGKVLVPLPGREVQFGLRFQF